MFKHFAVYILDTETTGLDHKSNDIIELSIYRCSDDTIKTWKIKPEHINNINDEALRINKHKLEDLLHQTEYGKANYLKKQDVMFDVENWFMEDNSLPKDRILVGQNVIFDAQFLQEMWKESKETFPFGDRPFMIDVRQIALFIDLCKEERQEFYNLNTLLKKFNIKNAKAHTAEADTLATKELFYQQIKCLR